MLRRFFGKLEKFRNLKLIRFRIWSPFVRFYWNFWIYWKKLKNGWWCIQKLKKWDNIRGNVELEEISSAMVWDAPEVSESQYEQESDQYGVLFRVHQEILSPNAFYNLLQVSQVWSLLRLRQSYASICQCSILSWITSSLRMRQIFDSPLQWLRIYGFPNYSFRNLQDWILQIWHDFYWRCTPQNSF